MPGIPTLPAWALLRGELRLGARVGEMLSRAAIHALARSAAAVVGPARAWLSRMTFATTFHAHLVHECHHRVVLLGGVHLREGAAWRL